MRPSAIFLPVLFLILIFTVFFPRSLRTQAAAAQILPSTSNLPSAQESAINAPSVTLQPVFPGLGEFATTVLNGNPNQVVGIFIEDLFALPVIQQPKDQPAYVSNKDNLVTQFAMPNQYGVIGLLAHNYLSGKLFFELQTGDEVVVIYGDGHSSIYRITQTEQFQALNPLSPYSDFIDPTDVIGTRMSSADLFNHIYTTPDHLVFQTCIDANGNSSWGRLFVSAKKEDTINIHIPALSSINNN
jgi:hypothetical protein